jgi:hypothetical protein
VFIPKQQVQESNLNYLEILRSITPEQLLKKQQAIARIAPRLQYSVVRGAYHSTSTVTEHVTVRLLIFLRVFWLSALHGDT